jgi:hypothetical protein
VLQFTGPGLEPLRQSLGLIGVGAQVTEVTDGVAELGIDVTPLIRRGQTLAASEGVFPFVFQNDHAAANNTLQTLVDPYAPAATITRGAGYPAILPPGYDVWVLWAYLLTSVNVGNFAGAQLGVEYSTLSTGLLSGAAPAAYRIPLILSDTEDAVSTIGTFLAENGSGLLSKRLGVRVPRGARILFESRTAGSAVATSYAAVGLLGIFPAGLGQDAIGGE